MPILSESRLQQYKPDMIIAVGFATRSGTADLLCRVIASDGGMVTAKAVDGQYPLSFDAATGVSILDHGSPMRICWRGGDEPELEEAVRALDDRIVSCRERPRRRTLFARSMEAAALLERVRFKAEMARETVHSRFYGAIGSGFCARSGRQAWSRASDGVIRCGPGSRHDRSRFVAVVPFQDGFVSDDVLDAMIDAREIVRYAAEDVRLEASEIGLPGSVALFKAGSAAYREEAHSGPEYSLQGESCTAILARSMCARQAERGPDFLVLGMLWGMDQAAHGLEHDESAEAAAGASVYVEALEAEAQMRDRSEDDFDLYADFDEGSPSPSP